MAGRHRPAVRGKLRPAVAGIPGRLRPAAGRLRSAADRLRPAVGMPYN